MDSAGAKLVEDLMDTLEVLEASIPDEAALYAAALNLLKKKGHGLGDIRQDFDKCIGALETKDREFEAQLKAQYQKRVGSKNALIENCKGDIAARQSQITALQAEMAELGVKSHEAEEAVKEETQKLELAQARFTLGYNRLHSEMEAHITKTMKYGEAL